MSRRAQPPRLDPGPWLAALVLGGIAAWVNSAEIPLLTAETPLFILGGAFVLAAFVLLGPIQGVVASMVPLLVNFVIPLWSVAPGLAWGGLLYTLEGLVALWLYKRVSSLPLAVITFWLTVGWPIDFLFYVFGAGLSAHYVVLLLVKQLLNGVVNATAAELLVMRPIRRHLPRSWGVDDGPVTVARYAFSRVVLLALLPVTLFGVWLARAEFTGVMRTVEAENNALAYSVVAGVLDAMNERQRALARFARHVAAAETPGDEDELYLRLIEDFPDLYLVARADSNGIVRRALAQATLDEGTFIGMDVGERLYFEQARERQEAIYSQLLWGRRTEDAELEPVLVIAEPVFADDGAFDGTFLVSVDIRPLAERLTRLAAEAGRGITLFDSNQTVINSLWDPSLVGLNVDSILLGRRGARPDRPIIEDFTRPRSVTYYPLPTDDRESEIGINLIHASFQPVPLTGWGVLVELPATYLHGRFMSVAIPIIGMFFLLVMLLFVVVTRFSQRITDPLRAVAHVARLITQDGTGKLGALERLSHSPLSEVVDVADSLGSMEEALTEKDLRTQAREEKLQHQLLHAQKMEAIGLLAGGVAHDFNNTLTPIVGYADLGADLAEGSELGEYFEQIGEAANRAKDITWQLLAFGRKQVLAVKSMSITEQVRSSEKLIRPLLRENIRLRLELSEYEGRVIADPSQVHQVLINLVVNAQDAMPSGGDLRISVEGADPPPPEPEEEIEPGRYVVLTVSDSGQGIAPEIVSHIFEPFFTTKGPNKGTGLGLSTVYGIVRQHGGVIRLESVAGRGTTFRLYFPESTAGRVAAPEPMRRSEPGHGRVLLVEDDDAVRGLLQEVLDQAGYDVVALANGEDALGLFGDDDYGFDLLVSDVVLPGINGRELFDALKERCEDLPVLFVSGYSHDVLAGTGLPHGAQLMMKPFRRRDIEAKVKEILGAGVAPVL